MDSHEASDLLEHFKLEAEVSLDYTLHISYRKNTARGIRKERVETRWYEDTILGYGGFGKVRLEFNAPNPETAEARAVKVIDKGRMQNQGIDYRREIAALAKFSKPQYLQEEIFVPLLGWFETPNEIYLAMEYFPLGDLSNHIDGTIVEEDAKQIVSDLLSGLEIMHREGFVHRDLKPQNIFVVQRRSPTWWVKIGDFGISKRIRDENSALCTMLGTPSYLAPEVFKVGGLFEATTTTSKYHSAVDIWSLGCVIYKLLTDNVPFQAPAAVTVERYCNGSKPFPDQPLSGKISHDGLKLLKSFLSPLPDQRPTAKLAHDDRWFQTDRDAGHAPEIKSLVQSDAETKGHTSPRPADLSSVSKTSSKPHRERDPGSLQFALRPKSYLEPAAIGSKHQASSGVLAAVPVEAMPLTLPRIPDLNSAVAVQEEGELQRQTKLEKAKQLLAESGFVSTGDDWNDVEALLYATYKGHLEIVRLLLARGIEVDSKGTITIGDNNLSCEASPLYFAIWSGHDAVVRTLLAAGADVEAKGRFSNNAEYPALIEAVCCGHLSVMHLLLRAGCNTEAIGRTSNGLEITALHASLDCEREDIVQLLLESGSDVEAKKKYPDSQEDTSLSIAAGRGNNAVIELLLKAGADVDGGAEYGATPLSRSAKRGHVEAASMLLDHGAAVDARDDGEWTPLHYAAYYNRASMVAFLLARGAFLGSQTKEGNTALHLAVYKGYDDVVRVLIEKGVYERKNVDGHTALHAATESGHEAIVRLLLDRGAYLESKTEKCGFTALHMAVQEDHKAVVRLLLDRGASLESKTKEYGWTALHLAAGGSREAVVRLLLDRGASLESKTEEYGSTALHLAATGGREAVITLLLDRDASLLFQRDLYGMTALHDAAENCHEGAVRVLVERGADLRAKTNSGHTAWDIAILEGHQNLKPLLKPPSGLLINDAKLQRTNQSRFEKFIRSLVPKDRN